MMEQINTKETDLPPSIKGFTRRNPDMSYTILLNARLTHEARLETYLHELEHIKNGDFDREEGADLIEAEAHGAKRKA